MRLAVLMAALACAWPVVATELPAAVKNRLVLRELPADSLSVYVQDVDNGDVLLAWHEDEARNPASTLKLLTTLVGLDLLGPTFTWSTDVYALGPVSDGVLDGDLLLRGGGDPFLVTERVWQLVRRIRDEGIASIRGDLVIDDSLFDVGAHDPGAFDNQPLRAYNVAPNALLMNLKVVRYWFEHDAAGVRIRTDPVLDNLGIENRLKIAKRACRGYQRGISIDPGEHAASMVFSGYFPSGCRRYALDRTALSHADYAYGLFRSLWREAGGEFDGGLRIATTPADVEPLLRFASLPLHDIVERINKHSNNVMARQLLYTLAVERLGPPGTEAGGRRVVHEWLEANDLQLDSLRLENGAGLSRVARISAADFGALLRFGWQQPYMPEFLSSLALSGLDGTLRRRLDAVGVRGRAHLKTGSLDHVAAIAGYVQAQSGRRFAVVALQNYPDVHRGYGDEVQAALIGWLVRQ